MDEIKNHIEVLKDFVSIRQRKQLREDNSFILVKKEGVDEAISFAIKVLERLEDKEKLIEAIRVICGARFDKSSSELADEFVTQIIKELTQ